MTLTNREFNETQQEIDSVRRSLRMLIKVKFHPMKTYVYVTLQIKRVLEKKLLSPGHGLLLAVY